MANVIARFPVISRLPAGLPSWLPVLLGLAAVFLPTYWTLAQHTWSQDEHAHGPLVLAASLFLAWRQRGALAAAAVQARALPGWLLLVSGMLLHAVGRSQEVIIMEVAAQIPVLLGVLLIARGFPAVRLLWFPLLFLVFMIPLPGFLVDSATGSLKQEVSVLAEQVLYYLGYPVGRSGVTLVVGPYQLLVADACSGLHTLFSLSAVGLLYVHLMGHPGWARNALLAAAILPVAFAANVVRVIALAVITYHFGVEAGQGLVHDLASPFMFTVALLSLVALDALWDRVAGKAAHPGTRVPAPSGSATLGGLAIPAPRAIVLGLALLSAVPLAMLLTPHATRPGQGPGVNLETLVPRQFGDWRVDERVVPLQADPETDALLARIYSQILSRTYVNGRGETVMLSIAYGGDQRESMQVHKPEVCYPAQGFSIVRETDDRVDTGFGAIPVRRLVAVQGRRIEPITYWMTIGDTIARTGGVRRKLEQIRHGLTGRIPDGLLFRVSGIGPDADVAYRLQDEFVRALLRDMSGQERARLIGRPAR